MANPQRIRTLVFFLAFGLPYLLGYGVLPLPNFINEMAALLGFGFLLILASRTRLPSLTAEPTYRWVMAAVGLLLVLTLFQAIRARHPGAYELYGYTLGYLLTAGLAFHVGWQISREEALRHEWIVGISRVVVFAGAIAAGAALIQYFRLPQPLGIIPYVDTAGRAFGFLRQPNHQASFLAIGVQALVFLTAQRLLRRRIAWPLAALLCAGVLASGSRMGLLQIAFVLLWSLWAFRSRARSMCLVIVLVLASLLPLLLWLHVHADVPFYFVAKLNQSLQEGAGARGPIWAETLRLIGGAPWLGVGLHRYGQMFILSDAAIHVGVVMGHSHNLILQLAFDYGVPAAAFVVLSLATALWLARRNWTDPSRACAFGILGCIAIHSMLEFPLWYVHFIVLGLFMLGVFVSGRSPTTFDVTPQRVLTRRASRWAQGAIAVLGACAVALSVWMNHDFYKVSPVFRRVAEIPIEQALADAKDVTWFRRYVRYAKYAGQPITAENAAAYWERMEESACLMLDPLYHADLVTALAYQGRLEEAERLIYIHWRVSKGSIDYLAKALASHQGPAFDRLRRYLKHPERVWVEPSRILPCLE